MAKNQKLFRIKRISSSIPQIRRTVFTFYTTIRLPAAKRRVQCARESSPLKEGGRRNWRETWSRRRTISTAAQRGRTRNRPSITISLSSTAVAVEEDRSTPRRERYVGGESGKGAHRANCNSVETIGPSGSQGERNAIVRGERRG